MNQTIIKTVTPDPLETLKQLEKTVDFRLGYDCLICDNAGVGFCPECYKYRIDGKVYLMFDGNELGTALHRAIMAAKGLE